MKVLCIAVGSRGDAEPFCAFAEELLSRGHQVEMFLQTDWQHLAPTTTTALHQLPFSMADFYRFMAGDPTHGAQHPNPRVRFIGGVADMLAELLLPVAPQLLQVARHSATHAIVASNLAFPIALPVSQKLSLPLAVVHLQPMAPNPLFPHYSNTPASVEAILHQRHRSDDDDDPLSAADAVSHLDSYHFLDRTRHEFLADRLAPLYQAWGMPLPTYEGFLQKALAGEAAQVHVVNAFSTELLFLPTKTGRSAYTGRHTHNIGPLADHYIPSDWTGPGAALEQFLHACDEPPICVGYGSMPVSQAAEVAVALQRIGGRAVLVGDALKGTEDGMTEWARENLFRVSSVPYAWLLPRCSMMLSHGGAGVLNATLRAGIPPVITPLMGDQSFWAQLVEATGIGAQAGGSLSAVTANELVDGVERGRACREAASKMGEAIRALPKGVESLARVVEGLMAAA